MCIRLALQCYLILKVSSYTQEQLAVDYTTKVIHSIASSHIGFFNCWIYNLEDADDTFISSLLQNPSVQTTSKQIMTSTNMSVVNPFEHNPSMIVIRCRICSSELGWKHLTLYRASVETKVLVVHQCRTLDQFNRIYFLFEQLKLANSVFLDLNTNLMKYTMFYKRERIVVEDFEVAPSELFVNQVRDLHGYYVTASVETARAETTVFAKHRIFGRDFAWIGDTAAHLNGSAGFAKIECDEERLSSKECERRRKYRKNKKPFDINLDSAIDSHMKAYCIDSVEPDRYVIMVRSGQRLTPLEVFAVPFHYYLWIMLGLLVFACWMLVLQYSIIFVNDPILAAMSGIERRSFHRTGTPEKLLILALTILFFFLLQAYETKIISLMTSYPYKADPRNLEDLQRSGIKIRYVEGHSKYFFNNPDLQNLVETVPAFQDMSEMFRYASFGEENKVNMIINMPNYFYARGDRPRCVVLKDYNLGIAIRQFWMSQRNLLAQVLKRSQRIFFEAGIRKLLMDHIMHIHRLKSELIARAELSLGFGEDDDILDIDELAPAWYVILIGWFFSVFVFAAEVVLKMISHGRITALQ